MRLPDPSSSRAILIGVGTYQSAELPDVPAIRNNLDGLAAALTDPDTGGFAAENCTVLIDPGSVRVTYRAIREYADRADDTLLVYFAGHGLTGARLGELYLGLADTEPSELLVSALSFNLIRDVFLDCPARNRVLVLDCCFSGRAIQDFLAAPRDAVLGELEILGTYILASAPPNALALAPPGAAYTAFTGELLTLLNTGIPDGDELITLGATYRHLRRAMVAKGLPAPGQRGTDTADLLALTRNPAYGQPVDVEPVTEPAPVADPEPAVPAPRRAPGATRVIAISTVLAIVTAVTVTLIVISTPSHNAASSPPPSQTRQPVTTTVTTTTTINRTITTTTVVGAVSPPPGSDVKQVSVRVFNNATVSRLAAQAASDFRSEGWNVVEVGNYSEGFIPSSTVYYRSGTIEETAARALAAKFNMRVAARLPQMLYGPGVVVMVTNDYGGK